MVRVAGDRHDRAEDPVREIDDLPSSAARWAVKLCKTVTRWVPASCPASFVQPADELPKLEYRPDGKPARECETDLMI